MDKQYEVVKLSRVMVDENQPRKYFDAAKLRQLQSSIKKEGIISPLIVERIGENFLLLDGERRFRAATELGLKEVPVIIEALGNKAERLARQFNVQEQHEGWTPSEKASAIIALSEEVGLSLYETCKLLGVSQGDIGRYTAFAQLVDRDNFIRNEIPVDYAQAIRSLTLTSSKLSEKELKKEFGRSDVKKLERRIVQGIKEGSISKRGEIIKIKDAFVKNPKLIEKFMDDSKETPTSIYLKAEAQGATALRNATLHSNYLINHARRYLNIRDVKMTPQQLASFKDTRDMLDKLIASAE